MAITLGTNIPSFVTRMNLNSVTDKLSTTLERLSTGQKINRAGDDSAGLVISENMKSYINRSKQAMDNIQTAEAFLTIAEDSMVSVGDHLQRISDLLENMANDTNDTASRTASIQEIIERLSEIDRLSENTNFNGRTMIDGSAKEIIVQMGIDETELSTLDIGPALSDCHVSALGPESRDDGLKGVQLPKELNPEEGDFEPNNENCRKYMAIVQEAISNLASNRGLLGAYENRMDSAFDSLSARIVSLDDAKAVYTDTDVAEEATNLVSRQIMQQLNVSVLSVANSMQQTALQLIGG